MNSQTVTIIGVLCAVLGFIVAFLTFNRNRDKDVRTEASESATIRAKLDGISQGVDSIRIDFKANEKRISQVEREVVRIDESTKSAHKRIDEIKKMKNEESV